MQKIILQPCGNVVARKNYEKTISSYVNLADIKCYLSAAQTELISNNCPDGKVHIWGVEDRDNFRNFKKWQRINAGDVAIFAWEKVLRSRGIVIGKFENIDLSMRLWNDGAYKNIYLLGEMEIIDIPYEIFNKSVGYSKKNPVRSFQVLNEKKSALALVELALGETSYPIDVSEEDYFDAIEKLQEAGTLNKEAPSYQRVEQPFLRQTLFGNKREAKCDMCGKIFSVDLLVAAHIKKRADCGLEEQKDFKNIAMSACKFGCDDLYEKGYLFVQDGIIIVNRKKYISPNVELYIKNIAGKICERWNSATDKYFTAHNEKFDK